MPPEYPELIDHLLQAWNYHDVEGITACYSPIYMGIDVGEANPQTGPSGIRASADRYLQAFPDLHVKPDEVVIQGNQVALAWTGAGTHRGPLMNIPPTGRKVTIRGISILTIEAGAIAKGLYIWDVAGLLRAINLLPEL